MLDDGDRELVRELHGMELGGLSDEERQRLREGVAYGHAADLWRIANRIRRDPQDASVADRIMEHLYGGDLRGASDVALEHVRDLEARLAQNATLEGANAASSHSGALSRAFRTLPAAAVFLAGVQGLSTGIGLVFDSIVAIVIAGIVFGMLGGIFLFDGRFAGVGVLGLLSSILGGVAVVELNALEHGPIVSDISVAQAHEHGDAKGFTFSDGVVRDDLRGEVSRSSSSGSGSTSTRPGSVGGQGSGSGSSTTYQAAPLATRYWQKGEPVHAWVVCVGDDCHREWSQSYRAGVRQTQGPIMDSYEAAVQKARTEHGLTDVAGAPILKWTPSIGGEASGWKLQAWLSYGLAYVVLIPGVLVMAWWRTRRSG